ncbi:MAG: iron-sulfur cluster assembly accessory protein [Chryseolinea sp.]
MTEAAAARVREIMDRSEKPYAGLRVGVKAAGCAGQSVYVWTTPEAAPNDEVVQDKGVTILIEPKAVLFLLGSEIDFETDALSSKFVFRNPERNRRLRLRRERHHHPGPQGAARRSRPSNHPLVPAKAGTQAEIS